MLNINYYNRQINCLINHLVTSDEINERRCLIKEIRLIRDLLNSEETIKSNIFNMHLFQISKN
jgi:hypothetical protein